MTKKQTLLKSLLFSLITLLVLFLAGFIYTSYNLATYQLYYAKHMPHAKGTNPEMVFILDGLDFSEEPKIKGIRYDTDGHNSIIKDNSFALRQSYDGKKETMSYHFMKGKITNYIELITLIRLEDLLNTFIKSLMTIRIFMTVQSNVGKKHKAMLMKSSNQWQPNSKSNLKSICSGCLIKSTKNAFQDD
ncbi:hypothetical protein [Streptococcus hyointestinalis]|uniref:hypothetical protein n=1 Tax=Streptococcus hyointestinalis TaxID=1337 RepID=UPI003CFCD498